MNPLQKTLTRIQSSGEPGLMTHLVAGYPNLKASLKLAQTLIAAKTDLLELQIPFSDPIADGPLLAAANQKALLQQVTLAEVLNLAKKLQGSVPILLMGYCNSIFKFGLARFCAQAQQAGVAGLIFPDLPFDEKEGAELIKFCQQFDLALIQVVSELTPQARLAKITQKAQGFIYCVSRLGTTGVTGKFSRNLQQFLQNVRRLTDLPLAVGFGIKSQQDVHLALDSPAEIAVVGSALMQIWQQKNCTEAQKLKQVRNFVEELKVGG